MTVCLAATLTGLAACTQATPPASAKPATASQSPTSAKPSAVASQSPSPAKPSAVADSSLHMIPNGDHNLAFHVTPGSLPALVLDAGGGADSSYWKNMVPTLAKKTGSMIVTYDRAGMGQSDEVSGPWQVENAVSDLEAGLTKLDITHDVILVSHSQAAEVATYFAQENPELVVGAVLVDGSLPEFYTDDEVAKIEAANKASIEALKDQPSTKQTRQLQAVAADYGPMHRAYHQVSWPQHIPATAIVSAATPFQTPEDAQLWRDAHQQFVNAAPNRNLVIADGSSHDIVGDRPEVVVAAVEKMLKTVGQLS